MLTVRTRSFLGFLTHSHDYLLFLKEKPIGPQAHPKTDKSVGIGTAELLVYVLGMYPSSAEMNNEIFFLQQLLLRTH